MPVYTIVTNMPVDPIQTGVADTHWETAVPEPAAVCYLIFAGLIFAVIRHQRNRLRAKPQNQP